MLGGGRIAFFIQPPARGDDITIQVNAAGELSLLDEGVDHNHLKQFSAVRPDRQHLFHPADFGTLDVAEQDDESNYPLGISACIPTGPDWSINPSGHSMTVWTYRNSGNEGTYQVAHVRDFASSGGFDKTTLFMRAPISNSGGGADNWTQWEELSGIEDIRAIAEAAATQVDFDAHKAATTDTHGVTAAEGDIESTSGAQAKAEAEADAVQTNLDNHAGAAAQPSIVGHVLQGGPVANPVAGDPESNSDQLIALLDSLRNAGVIQT